MSTKHSSRKLGNKTITDKIVVDSRKRKDTIFKDGSSVVACAVFNTVDLDEVQVFNLVQIEDYILNQILEDADQVWNQNPSLQFRKRNQFLPNKNNFLNCIQRGQIVMLELPLNHMVTILPLNTEMFICQSGWRDIPASLKKLQESKQS